MPQYLAMAEYWAEFPPPYKLLRMMAEGLFGKAVGTVTAAPFKPSTPEELMQGLGGPGMYGR